MILKERIMPHRSGATLMEVLVAIFVTSIGLLGLLALFPLGVLNMARAVQDERAAQACRNAAAIASMPVYIHNDPPFPPGTPRAVNMAQDDSVAPDATNPGYSNPPLTNPGGGLPVLSTA